MELEISIFILYFKSPIKRPFYGTLFIVEIFTFYMNCDKNNITSMIYFQG